MKLLLLAAAALLVVALAVAITWAVETDTDRCLQVAADEVEP